MISFTVPAVPVAQPRPRAFICKGHARVYQAPKHHAIHDFKAIVRLIAAENYVGPLLTGPLRLELIFVLPRPGRLRWKKRPMPRLFHDVKPDADNLQKSIQDALTGILWKGDEQLAYVLTKKFFAGGDEVPHVDVSVLTLK